MTTGSAAASDAAREPRRRRGGTVAMLVDPEPPTLVAVTNCGDPSMLVSAKVTEGLLAYDFDLTPKPQLAVDWSVDRQFTRFEFKLRRGVSWHDGAPFTAHDAAFSISLLKNVHARGRVTFANVEDVRALDAETLVLRLAKPAPYLLQAFAGCESPIVPRHRYEGMDPAKSPNSCAPIGTGPFTFKEWVRGSRIVYERNAAYWDHPKPYVDRLVVHVISDPARRFSAIASGDIALAPATPLSLQQIEYLRRGSTLAFDMNGYQYLNQVVRLEFNLDDPVLKDVRVRRAIAHAVDRSEILRHAWRGYGAPAYGPISPALRQFQPPDRSVHAFDPRRAEDLLDQAGFARGADGLRVHLTHDVVPAGEPYEETARHVARQLGKIGIAVTLRTETFSTYIKRVYTDRDFSFATNRANNMFDPTIGVQRLFWSKNFKAGVPFSNASHYANSEADRLLEAAAVEPDPRRRLVQFSRFQDLIARDLPDVTLLAPSQVTVARADLRDHTVTADGTAGNLADMYLAET
ncbi:MAG: ABC transporter substrate-binding protein [Alphaproteobacteria bacterium]|nr:ABC transporter substrate-binding protein [Alphaproteobacteria bacterium]